MTPDEWLQEIIDAESAIQPKQIRTEEMAKKTAQEEQNDQIQESAEGNNAMPEVVNEDDRIFAVIKSLKINMGKLSEPGRKRLVAMLNAYLS